MQFAEYSGSYLTSPPQLTYTMDFEPFYDPVHASTTSAVVAADEWDAASSYAPGPTSGLVLHHHHHHPQHQQQQLHPHHHHHNHHTTDFYHHQQQQQLHDPWASQSNGTATDSSTSTPPLASWVGEPTDASFVPSAAEWSAPESYEDAAPSELIARCRSGYQCQVLVGEDQQPCGRIFPRRDRALTHVHVHYGVRPYSCEGACGAPDCTKRFHSISHLRAHSRPVRAVCTKCRRLLLRKNLKRHMANCGH